MSIVCVCSKYGGDMFNRYSRRETLLCLFKRSANDGIGRSLRQVISSLQRGGIVMA